MMKTHARLLLTTIFASLTFGLSSPVRAQSKDVHLAKFHQLSTTVTVEFNLAPLPEALQFLVKAAPQIKGLNIDPALADHLVSLRGAEVPVGNVLNALTRTHPVEIELEGDVLSASLAPLGKENAPITRAYPLPPGSVETEDIIVALYELWHTADPSDHSTTVKPVNSLNVVIIKGRKERHEEAISLFDSLAAGSGADRGAGRPDDQK